MWNLTKSTASRLWMWLWARHSTAGRSAFAVARRLRRAQRLLAAKWWTAVAVTAGLAVAGARPPGGLPLVVAAAVAAGAVPAAVVLQKDTGARRWQQGAEAERRTGHLLRVLAREGWHVMHDRSILGSKANIDHLVIHPSGAVGAMIDTKAYHMRGAKIRWDLKRGCFMYGPYNKTETLQTCEWEAGKAAAALGIPVVTVLCMDGGDVVGGVVRGRTFTDGPAGILLIDGSYVVESGVLVDTLLSLFSGIYEVENRKAVRKIARLADSNLPQKNT